MIQIVIGKPGSGKSYHIVKYILDQLETMAVSGVVRKIYTNLPLNFDEISTYIKEKTKTEINVSEVVTILYDKDLAYNEEYLENGEKKIVNRGGRRFLEIDSSSKAFFWNRLENEAIIIIDEIQKFLGGIKEVGESEKQSLVEYFSQHRHKKHDWIFITQSLLSLSVDIRRVSEEVIDVFNAKSLTLPFPLRIPLRDIDNLFKAFGIYRQVYRVRRGVLDGTYKVEYDPGASVYSMEKYVFRCYRTHTKIDDSGSLYVSDSTLPFKLGPGQRRRALAWFVRKHFLHVSLNLLICFFVVFMFYKVIVGLFNMDLSSMIPTFDGVASKSEASSSSSSLPVGDGSEVVEQINLIDKNEKQKNDRISNFSGQEVLYNGPIKYIDGKRGLAFLEGAEVSCSDVLPSGLRVVRIDPRYGVWVQDAQEEFFDCYIDLYTYWMYGPEVVSSSLAECVRIRQARSRGK